MFKNNLYLSCGKSLTFLQRHISKALPSKRQRAQARLSGMALEKMELLYVTLGPQGALGSTEGVELNRRGVSERNR